MAENAGDRRGGITFLGALTVVFIALKLMGYIDWSWVWVLAPLWIPLGASALVLGTIQLVGWVRRG